MKEGLHVRLWPVSSAMTSTSQRQILGWDQVAPSYHKPVYGCVTWKFCETWPRPCQCTASSSQKAFTGLGTKQRRSQDQPQQPQIYLLFRE